MDRHVDVELTRINTPGQDAADEIVAIEQGDEEAKFGVGVDVGLRDVRDDRLEQRRQSSLACIDILAGITVATRCVEHRKIELFIARAHRDEHVEHLVEHFGGAAIGTIDLVDDDDRAQAQRQRLAGHELGLRHRAFGRIHQQYNAIDHRQDALDFAAEIGVSGRVDDIDPRGFEAGIGTARSRLYLTVPFDAGALGQNRNPALFLKIVRIHRALFDALVFAEGARLTEQLVDQRGFAVIDVSDNGDIAKRARGGHEKISQLLKRQKAPPIQRRGWGVARPLPAFVRAFSRDCALRQALPWPLTARISAIRSPAGRRGPRIEIEAAAIHFARR